MNKNITTTNQNSKLALSKAKSLMSITSKILTNKDHLGMVDNFESFRLSVTFGHMYSVESLAVSPSGKYMVSCGYGEYDIKIWDVESGKQIRNIIFDNNGIKSVAFSPNGKYIASGNFDNVIKLFEVNSGKEMKVFKGLLCGVTAVVFSSDGKYIAGGGYDGIIKLWDIESEKEIHTFIGDDYRINSIAIILNDKYLIGGYGKNDDMGGIYTELFSIETGESIKLNTLDGSCLEPELCGTNDPDELYYINYESEVYFVAEIPNSNYIVTSGFCTYRGVFIKIYDKYNFKLIGHRHEGLIKAVSANGNYIVTAYKDTIEIWDIKTWRLVQSFQELNRNIKAISMTQDNRYLMSGCHDGLIRLWEVATGKEVINFKRCSTNTISEVKISKDGKYFETTKTETIWHCYDNEKISTNIIWETETGERLTKTDLLNKFRIFINIVYNGLSYAVGVDSDDSTCIQFFEKSQDMIVKTFKGHGDTITSVAVTPDGQYLISGSYDKTIKLWEISSCNEIRTFKGHGDTITSVAVTPDGQYVVSGSDDGTIKLWDISNGEETKSFETNSRYDAWTISISSDGKFIVSGGYKAIELWDIARGKEIRKFIAEYTFMAVSLSITADSKYIIIDSESSSDIQLLEIETGNKIHEINNLSVGRLPSLALLSNENLTIDLEQIIWSHEGYYNINGSSKEFIEPDRYGSDNLEVFFNKAILFNITTSKIISNYASFGDEWLSWTSDGYYNCSEGAYKYFCFVDDNKKTPEAVPQNHPVYNAKKKDRLF